MVLFIFLAADRKRVPPNLILQLHFCSGAAVFARPLVGPGFIHLKKAAFPPSQQSVALLGIAQRTIHVTFGPIKHPENCSKPLQIKT
jgi:hypothetical protein